MNKSSVNNNEEIFRFSSQSGTKTRVSQPNINDDVKDDCRQRYHTTNKNKNGTTETEQRRHGAENESIETTTNRYIRTDESAVGSAKKRDKRNFETVEREKRCRGRRSL